MRDENYDQLTESQQRAINHKDGPLLVIAGPGSGKTRVITHRISALIRAGISPYNICAITFTNKAAQEMLQRTYLLGNAAGVHISTFHSLCVRILRQYGGKVGVRPNFSIYDSSDQRRCMKQAIKDCELDTTNFSPARILEAVSALKNKLIDNEDFKRQADDYFSRSLARIYQTYQNILADSGALDFDDLLFRTALLLQKHKDICTLLSNRFRYLLIDEYQDTNHAQYVISRLLVTSHNNICVAGDPDQSIYRWRGADIRNILDFEKDWPDATTVRLEENFRSTPNILRIADNLISFNQKRKKKKLIPVRKAGPSVEIIDAEDEEDEAYLVVKKIKKLSEKGINLSEIAVFYRVNAMSRAIEEQCIKQKISYQIVRGVEFYSRKEIRDIIAYLKVLVNPDDEISLLRIINTPARGIGKTTIDRIGQYAKLNQMTFYEALKTVHQINALSKSPKTKVSVFVSLMESFKKHIDENVGKMIEVVFDKSGLQSSLEQSGAEGKNAIENVKELINSGYDYHKNTDEPSLLDYMQQIALFSDTDTYDPSAGKVVLCTLHAAKGLEFENVFIIGLEEGILPHERSSDDESDIEEERRLFFVGVTRAKSFLQLYHVRYRKIRGQLMRTVASPFLYELGIGFVQKTMERTVNNDQMDFDDKDTYVYDSSDIEADLPLQDTFHKNQLVRHDMFGLGRVKQFVDKGENSFVIVKFNTGQTKSLVLKYANLTKA